LNHILSICIRFFFGVDAIGGDGVMGVNVFYSDDYSQCFIPNVFLDVIQKNYYHIVQLEE
jgi:hypothetical protein